MVATFVDDDAEIWRRRPELPAYIYTENFPFYAIIPYQALSFYQEPGGDGLTDYITQPTPSFYICNCLKWENLTEEIRAQNIYLRITKKIYNFFIFCTNSRNCLHKI